MEIGCGTGSTLKSLRDQGLYDWVCGVELDPETATIARKRLDAVYQGNIESLDLNIAPSSIDLILCLDVLEHIQDPWLVLKGLRQFLTPGKTLIAIVPNVRFFKVSFPLFFLNGWRYGSEGVLDRTHLRFFVSETAIELLNRLAIELTT